MPKQNSSFSEPPACTQCGATLPSGRIDGLCPECLLEQGLATETDVGTHPNKAPETASRPLPDQEEIARLFPQFEILDCLGRGGMGVVYKARQKALDRLVALKILAPEREKDQQFAARFAHEAKTLAQLNHPNIVTVYEFGESESLFFFAMEFVDGVNLRQLILEQTISPDEALAIVPAICAALQYAHDKGVVHRDIKPENLLIDTEGRVKVADFGIARLMAHGPDATPPGDDTGVAGTPKYMAPEQKQAVGAIDHRADIYSLGLVFYELLTGHLPQEALRLPSSPFSGAPGDFRVRLDELVFRTMEKNPEHRFQQASEVQTAVNSVATETGAVADPASRPAADAQTDVPVAASAEEPSRPARKRLRLFSLFALLALVAVGGSVFVTYPLWPHEYLYDRGTSGTHSRYPLLGEAAPLLEKRFAGSILEEVDGENGGRQLRIASGDCTHRVWVQDGQVEAVLLVSTNDALSASLLAADYRNHSAGAGAFEPRGEELWWNPDSDAAMAIKDERTLLVASEKGIDLLMDR